MRNSCALIFKSSCHLILIFMGTVLITGCGKSSSTMVEQQPVYQPSPVSPGSQLALPRIATAKLSDVEEAVKRVFKDRAVVSRDANPAFIVGDYNGDNSQDVAVVVIPAAGKLSLLNEEYPAWLLRDPFAANIPPKVTLLVDDQETLLAIIHGYGSNDWRDSQATQTFLLKNAVGTGLETKPSSDFVKANSGRKIPLLHGDVISETVRGTAGYLYYSNATYAWYDPRTYKEPNSVHAVHSTASKVPTQ